MKSTIWLKVFVFVTIPFMLLYAVQSVLIIQISVHDKTEKAKQDVENAARFSGANFQNYVETVKLALVIAARELQDIDITRPDARDLGERVLISGFRNGMVINTWLIFEPNAFDGRDAEHRGEYPGESSGRYMRSYVRQGNGYVEAPDMYEDLLDDMDVSYWYLVPRITRSPFIDVDDEYGYFWDYGAGEGQFDCISLSVPVFRDGEFIGCVGQDILLTKEILGPAPGVVSTLFTATGVLRCHEDPGKVGKSLEELGFPGSDRIKEALGRKESMLLSGDYSPLLDTGAFACFYPVKFGDFDKFIYIYAAVPKSSVWDALFPMLRLFVYTFVIFLVIFIMFLYYLFRAVSRPVHDLSLACEAISRGNFDTEIARPRSLDEIGIMAQSLYRMVEQFKIHITMQERSRQLLDMYTRLSKALYRQGRMEDVFDEMMPVIGDFFAVRRASLVLVTGETARIFASFEPGKGVQRVEGEQFLYHQQAAALLAGRKYLSLNANALRNQKIDFAGSQVLFLCILPFLVFDELKGYIIMEGDSETGPIVHNDTALLFLSETISFMLTQKEAAAMNITPVERPAEAPPGTEELPVIKAARTIGDLDVDKGLFHSGGAGEQYGKLLRISAKSFTVKMQTMRSFYTADLPAFGIEIHGIKGALNAIGAGGLGDLARELEFAAKSGDAEYCARAYPVFEEKLAAFTAQLEAITRKQQIPSRGPGSIPVLIGALEEALESSRMFDSAGAGERITPLLEYSWEDGKTKGDEELQTGETLEKISDALDSMNYDEAERNMIRLLEYLKAGEYPGNTIL
ncbi:MAG: HAMP domain-containing protein [Treponema sp.]|jgi:HAMP domain-containing protein|nr:HAMP domain-containing protein [Treponema sp.]